MAKWDEERLNEFHQEFKEHVESTNEILTRILTKQTTDADAIASIKSDTAGLVLAWNNANGAIRVGATLGRFIKWATGLAVIGVGLQWLIDHSH